MFTLNQFWKIFFYLVFLGGTSVTFANDTSKEESICDAYFPNSQDEETYFLEFIYNEVRGKKVEAACLEFLVDKARSFHPSKTLTFAEISFRIAELLRNESETYRAYEFLSIANDILAKEDLITVDFAADFYETKGVFLYKFGRLKEARKNLLKALKYSVLNPVAEVNVYNSLGLIYRQLNEYDTSEYYFKKSLRIAEENDIDAWKGVLVGNLGYTYYLKGDTVNAKEYLKLDRDLSIENGAIESAIHAICILIEFELSEKTIDSSVETSMRVLDSLIAFVGEYSLKYSYYKVKTAHWKYLGEYQKALESFQLSKNYLDSARAEYDQLNLRNLEFQIDFEKRRNETELLYEKKRRSDLMFNFILALLLVILSGGFFSMYQLRKRKQKEKKILELENERIQLELDRNKKELHKIFNNLAQKNELIETLNQELLIKESQEKTKELEVEKMNLHEKIQSFTLLTEEDLIEFKRTFNKLYPDFYNKLKSMNSGLTNAEMRLAMLIKSNLSNLEMSRILGISQDSVRKTNLRLRKKLAIKTTNELSRFILSV